MTSLLWIAFSLALLGYLFACVFFVASIQKRNERLATDLWAPRFLRTGLFAHIAYLVMAAGWERSCPVYSLHSALGIISLAGVITYVLLARTRRMDAMGAVAAGAAVIFLAAGRALSESDNVAISHRLMAVHITSNLVGSGVLLLAGGASAFYLWQGRRLKTRKQIGSGPRLPALDVLDSLVHRLLWIGLPILSVGMVTGRWVITHIGEITPEDRIRALISSASWALLLVCLLLRQAFHWRGRKPAALTVIGTLGVLSVVILYILRSLGVTE